MKSFVSYASITSFQEELDQFRALSPSIISYVKNLALYWFEYLGIDTVFYQIAYFSITMLRDFTDIVIEAYMFLYHFFVNQLSMGTMESVSDILPSILLLRTKIMGLKNEDLFMYLLLTKQFR
jgi:hypothetical protein